LIKFINTLLALYFFRDNNKKASVHFFTFHKQKKILKIEKDFHGYSNSSLQTR